MKKRFIRKDIGFTVIELLVTIAIIAVLGSIVLSNLNEARGKAQVAASGFVQKNMSRAIAFYFDDMGFYPPDVGRGYDPGLVQSVPWSPDGGTSPGTSCAHCPSNWENIVAANWNGPYLSDWTATTEWGGKYDYNYWGSGASRYGCSLNPGVYVGVQGDYSNNNTIPPDAEQDMIDSNFDSEQCLNGESQMLLWAL